MMKTILKTTAVITTAMACAIPVFAADGANDGPVLTIRDFIGTVNITNSGGQTIEVSRSDGARYHTNGNKVEINDNQSLNDISCKGDDDNIRIRKGSWYGGRGYKRISEYPNVEISIPANTRLVIDDSLVFGQIGNVGSADLELRSCGDLKLGNVAGTLDLKLSGSSDLDMGNAGAAKIVISGSGDVEAQKFGPTTLTISGSGDVELDSIEGDATLKSSGSGDISIGDIRGNLDYIGGGSSDLEIASVMGDTVFLRSSGSGDVEVDDGNVTSAEIIASGASDIEFLARSVDAKVKASGASDITLLQPSGNLAQSDSGASHITVR